MKPTGLSCEGEEPEQLGSIGMKLNAAARQNILGQRDCGGVLCGNYAKRSGIETGSADRRDAFSVGGPRRLQIPTLASGQPSECSALCGHAANRSLYKSAITDPSGDNAGCRPPNARRFVDSAERPVEPEDPPKNQTAHPSHRSIPLPTTTPSRIECIFSLKKRKVDCETQDIHPSHRSH